MKKQGLLNLFLLITVLALASTIYFSNEKNTQLETLTGIDTAELETISIRHNDSTTSLTKKDNTWTITRPINIAANNFRINTLLKLYKAPVHQQYQSDELDLNTIGLSNPKTSIRFDDTTIFFGIINPVTNLRYIQIDDHIYTIEDVYFPLISSHYSTLVSLNLLPTESAIEKLILINQTISKDEKNRWISNITINADTVASTIQQWSTQQAFGIHAYLKRKQLGDIYIYTEQATPIHYQITDTDPWLILARPDIGLEYHIDIDAYDQLIAPQ